MSQSVFIFCQTVIVQQMKLGGGGGEEKDNENYILLYITVAYKS